MQAEETREQIVLIVDGPIADKAEAFPEPEHHFESGNGSTCRVEGLEAADLGHVFLHPKMVALNALLQMLGDIMDRVGMQKPIIDDSLDR